jgi:hypothetical protein
MLVNKTLKSYFNSTSLIVQEMNKKYDMMSDKIFLSKASYKHNINSIDLTVYIYNKHKYYLLNKIKRIQKRFIRKYYILLLKNI